MWLNSEDALLAMLQEDIEVMDTEYNDNIDFMSSAVPTEIEWDLESGLVVLDEDGNSIHTDVGDVDMYSMMSVSQLSEMN